MRDTKLCLAFISIALAYFAQSTFAQPRIDNEGVLQEKDLTTTANSFALKTFVDKQTLKKGDTVRVRAWIESDVSADAEISVVTSEEILLLQGPDSKVISLPMTDPVVFEFLSLDPGKVNILLHASGKEKGSQESISLSQQVSGLEIQPSSGWRSALVPSSLIGVLTGSLLTFVTTLFNDSRQIRREKLKRKQWLMSVLPAQLEANRVAVERQKLPEYEIWKAKFLSEGYVTDLYDLAKERKIDGNHLLKELLKTSFLLQDYGQELAAKRSTQEKRNQLTNEISEVIKLLGSLE